MHMNTHRQFSRVRHVIALATLSTILLGRQSAQGAESIIPLNSTNASDTFVRSSVPDESFNNIQLNVGGWGDIYESLFKFDLSILPSTTTQLKLMLYSDPTYFSGGTSVGMSLNRVTSAWNSQITWNTKPAYTAVASLPAATVGQWYEVDLTSQLSLWKSGTENHGILLHPDGTSNQWNRFTSTDNTDTAHRPYLKVTYHGPYTVSGTVSGALAGADIMVTASTTGTPQTVKAATNGSFSTAPLPEGSVVSISAYADENHNGKREPWEAKGSFAGNPITLDDHKTGIDFAVAYPPDTDGDSMPDDWEVENGLQVGVNDSSQDKDGDGLKNGMEALLGSTVGIPDTDSDGINDGQEYYSNGTSVFTADTDGDGMPDKWEIDHQLDPLHDDRTEDRDSDFLSNWDEFNAGLNPSSADSDGNGVTDYKQLKGKTSWDALHDRTNRLLGVRHERGASFGYQYDGNSNLIRQVKLGRDDDNDGLSDLWEFSHGLDPKSSNGTNGMAGDLDGDGWTNQQEQLANSDPSSATDKPGINGTILGSLAVPFVPTEFISAAGQLDGSGSQELLVGADGNPGSVTNFVRLFTEGGTGWQGEDIQIGAYGVTSAVIGQLPGKQGAIYLGLRKPGGIGKVVELTRNGAGSWQTRTIVEGTGEAAFVLGLRTNVSPGDLVFSGSTRFGPDGALYRAVPNGENWDVSLLEREASHRGNGLVASMSSSDQAIRLLDQGGIQVSESKSTTQNLEEFNDGTIAGTWATGGHNDAGGSWSVQETGGNFRFAVTWTTSGSNNDSDAWAEANLLWPGDWQAIQISIPSSAHSNSSYGGGDAYVQVGDVTVYSNGTNATRQNVLVQIIRNDQLIYFRRQINGAAWEAWSSGTLSSSNPSKLRFGVWGQEPNGGSASLNVDYVRYLPSAQILALGASPDFASTIAAYNGTTSTWYFKTPAAVPWREAQLLAHSLGGNLATLDSADANTWLQGKFSGDFWVGYFRNSSTSPWQWVSNSHNLFTPIPWASGQPSTSADQVYAFSNAGQWSSATGTELKSGIIELKSAVPQVKPTVVSEPTSINRLQIPSRSLTVGRFNSSTSSESSLVEAFVEDRTPLGVVNDGDEIVVSELVLGSNPATQRTLTRRTLTGSGLSSHYGLAAVRNRTGTSEFLVTAECDGRVFAWLPPSAGASLERKTLSVEHIGYSWHGLERIPLAGGVDGLLGLRVASTTPQSVDLVYWDPSDLGFSTPPVIQQSPPTARLVTTYSGGGATAPLSVRLWDSEGNLARVGFQFKDPTSGLWQDATVPLVNGAPPLSGFHLATGPAGVTHAAAWNAAQDLGSAYRGNVLLRVQGSDNCGSGAWSEPFAYSIAGLVDTDNDGMPDAWESSFGLNPSVADANQDNDHDGVDNLMEFALGMNPSLSDAQLLPKITLEGGYATFTVNRNVDASNLVFTPQIATTLGAWNSGPGVFTIIEDTSSRLKVRMTDPISVRNRAFIRLAVTKP